LKEQAEASAMKKLPTREITEYTSLTASGDKKGTFNLVFTL
jgi:hypothetical protein